MHLCKNARTTLCKNEERLHVRMHLCKNARMSSSSSSASSPTPSASSSSSSFSSYSSSSSSYCAIFFFSSSSSSSSSYCILLLLTVFHNYMLTDWRRRRRNNQKHIFQTLTFGVELTFGLHTKAGGCVKSKSYATNSVVIDPRINCGLGCVRGWGGWWAPRPE